MTRAQARQLGIKMPSAPRRPKGAPPVMTELEAEFLSAWRIYGLPFCPPKSQVKFHPIRDWRFDWAWEDRKVGVELHGGEFMKKGGHTTGVGLTKDCEKIRAAQLCGWIVLPWPGREFRSDPEKAVKQVIEALVLHGLEVVRK